MFFDTLESRRLMSATVINNPLFGFRPADRSNLTVAPAPSVLNVVGTNGNDFFYARDDQFDMVDGGQGTDRAQVDRSSPGTDGRNSLKFLV